MAMGTQFEHLLRRVEMGSGGYLSPGVTILISLNTLIFLINLFTGSLPQYSSPVAQALLANEQIWDGQLWRLITAAFNHEMVMHWFWNMLGLFFFGHYVERHLGCRGLLLLTMVVAVVANGFHVAVMGTSVLGFSGVVYAIIVAFAAIAPTARVLMLVIPMQAWVLAALFVGLDTLHFIQYGSQSGTAYDVHLIGAALGFIAIRGSFLWRPLQARLQWRRAHKHQQRQQWQQQELDRLLEKVSADGLPSLTAAERKFLHRYSQSQRNSL